MRITTLVFTLITVFFSTTGMASSDILLEKDVVLYKGKVSDPYYEFFDFKVPTPGPVVARFIFQRAEPRFKKEKQDFGSIVLRPGADKHVLDSKKLGTRRANKVNKTIDAYEMDRFKGKYRVMLSNVTNNTVIGKLIIRAPRVSTDPIDLGINRIYVTGKGYLAVEIENYGKTPVPQNFYGKDSPVMVMISLPDQNRSWGGAALPIVDKKGALRKPGGKTNYVSNLKIGVPTRVQVNLRFDKGYKDSDVKNNTRVKTVEPSTQGRPDLRIRSVFLEEDRVGFMIENMFNAPLPDKLWATKGKDAAVVLISINGQSKGGITLNALPDGRKLDKKQQIVRYVSNIRVPQGRQSSVTVEIRDPKKLTGDRNRSNNRMQRKLQPQ